MKKKSFWKDTVIVGLALFSTMFGACSADRSGS